MTNPPAHIWDIRKFEDAPAAIEAFCHDAQQKWMEVNKVEGSRIKDVLKDYRTLFKSQAKKHKEHKDLLEDLRKYIARVKAEAVRQELEAELSARISEGSTRGSDGTNKENNTKANPEDLADIGDVVDTLQKVTLTVSVFQPFFRTSCDGYLPLFTIAEGTIQQHCQCQERENRTQR